MIDFEQQFKAGVEAAKKVKIAGQFERVIFCGLGGSAIAGEMISMLWLEGVNCYINHTFGLPHWVNSKCLVVCTSWSGDTEETISSLAAAGQLGIPVVVISQGGKLLELAQARQVPFIVLPPADLPPRLAVGYMLTALLTLLSNSAIIDNNPVSSLSFAANAAAPVSGLAARISDKIPLIYSSYQWRYLARFWKVNFNENSKVHSFSNYLPEAAHNELAGFQPTQTDFCFPIILIDQAEDPNDIRKLEKFSACLNGQGFDSQTIELSGHSRLEKILNNYNQAIATSTELAKLRGIDPLDDSTIEQFKKL